VTTGEDAKMNHNANKLLAWMNCRPELRSQPMGISDVLKSSFRTLLIFIPGFIAASLAMKFFVAGIPWIFIMEILLALFGLLCVTLLGLNSFFALAWNRRARSK
jgi:hypothetical protein